MIGAEQELESLVTKVIERDHPLITISTSATTTICLFLTYIVRHNTNYPTSIIQSAKIGVLASAQEESIFLKPEVVCEIRKRAGFETTPEIAKAYSSVLQAVTMTMIQCALDYTARELVSDSDSDSDQVKGYSSSDDEGSKNRVGLLFEESTITVKQLVGFRRDDQLRSFYMEVILKSELFQQVKDVGEKTSTPYMKWPLPFIVHVLRDDWWNKQHMQSNEFGLNAIAVSRKRSTNRETSRTACFGSGCFVS